MAGFLLSRAVDDDDSFNTTNYQNRAAVRPIDRVCIGQIHDVIRTSNIGCEWDLNFELIDGRSRRDERLTAGKEDRGFMSIVVDRNLDVVVRENWSNAETEGAGEVGFDGHHITWSNAARCYGDFTKPSSFRTLLTSGLNTGRYHSCKKQEHGRECQLHCE